MSDENAYISPLSSRYASREMGSIFSQEHRVYTFRRLWIALAKAQQKAGLRISDAQIAEMEQNKDLIHPEAAARYEKELRHDVMAEIHAFSDLCPKAKPIIHLGATSCFVTDNADLIHFREALELLSGKLAYVLKKLSQFALKHAASPCLSYTHFQSAQPTTFGKRACLWLQDFLFDAKEWSRLAQNLPFLGAKGATGTQASLATLLNRSSEKIELLEKTIANEFGFFAILPISGQTYTRKIDLSLANALASFAASAHKMATDIRLLSHTEEMRESFGRSQVGSSAMPYKRNPITSERICGLARFAISLAQNPAYTTATQWLERSLDDSSNRRLCLSEIFLTTDAILELLSHLIDTMQPVPEIALARIEQELPQLLMENVLMEAVKRGGNRQQLHEKLRTSSHLLLEELIEKISGDREFHLSASEIKPLASMDRLIGQAPEQVHQFLEGSVFPYIHESKIAPISPRPLSN